MYKRLSVFFSALIMFAFVAGISIPGCEDGRGPDGEGPPGLNRSSPEQTYESEVPL